MLREVRHSLPHPWHTPTPNLLPLPPRRPRPGSQGKGESGPALASSRMGWAFGRAEITAAGSGRVACLLYIAADDPYSLPSPAEPATPNPRTSRRAGTLEGNPRRGLAATLTRRNRRGFSAAGPAGWGRRPARDIQHGQPGELRPPSANSGSGCAAALLRGTDWAMPAWANAVQPSTVSTLGANDIGAIHCITKRQ